MNGFSGSRDVGQGIGRVQDSVGWKWRFGAVLDVLCLAGEQEFRILPLEIECRYRILPRQLPEQGGVELGDASAVGRETR